MRTEKQQRQYEKQRAWRRANPEKQREYSKKYDRNNPEKRRQKDKRYHQNNKSRRSHYHRTWRLEKKYSLTRTDFDFMSLMQGDACAICRQGFTGIKVCVDHNHKTGKVRGLLCDLCNRGIGLLKDSPSFLRIAATYIEAGEQHE